MSAGGTAALEQTWYDSDIEVAPGKTVNWRAGYWPKQIEFLQATERYLLFGGARGPGKTVALVDWCLIKMLQYPGIPGLLLRKDLKDLKLTDLREILARWPKELYDPQYGGQFNKGENWFRVAPTMSTLYLGELKDWESYKSATLGFIAIDELNEVEEDAWLNLDPTLRWTTGKGVCQREKCKALGEFYREHHEHPNYQIASASNPAPGWVKDRWWTPHQEGTTRPDHRFIPATAFDNPSLPPDFIPKLMESHNATWVRNYIHGDWSSFENMVWPRFNRADHCWKGPVPFKDFVRIVGGIDYGGTTQEAHRTAAYLTGQTRSGLYVTFWEYSKQGAASADFFAKLAEAQRLYRPERWDADASQHRANELLRNNGLPVHDAARYKGAVKDGINQVDRLMTLNEHTKTPQLYVVEESCPRLISGIETYKLDPVTGEPEPHQEDDEVNAWRYNVMAISRFEGAAPKTNFEMSVIGAAGVVHKQKPSGMLTAIRAGRSTRLRRVIEDLERTGS